MSAVSLAMGVVLAGILQSAHAAALPMAYRTVAADYQIPAQVLYRLAQTTSGNALSKGHPQPWPWVITVAGRTQRYPSRSAATVALQRYLKQDQRPLAVGLLQLDPKQFSAPNDALDPWHNLRQGAAVISNTK